MYIARDSDDTLRVFGGKPERSFYNGNDGKGYWHEVYAESIELSKEEDCYPELRWEDEPIKVVPVSVEDLMKFKVILAYYTQIKYEM